LTLETLYIQPSLKREWEDFGLEQLRRVRERCEEVLGLYLSALQGKVQGIPLLIIMGGFGVGKTQLLFHLFKYLWRQGVPALYVTLEILLSRVREYMHRENRERLSPGDFADIVSRAAVDNIEVLYDRLVKGTPFRGRSEFESLLWLPIIEGGTHGITPSEYFKEIGIDLDKVHKGLEQVKQTGRGVVVLIDEVEKTFDRLRELIEGGRPLRGIADAVGRLEVPAYLVFAVSHVSYYELLQAEFTESPGEAAAGRRLEEVYLPVLEPSTFCTEVRHVGIPLEKCNSLWWFTRGRLGYVYRLKNLISVRDADRNSLLEWRGVFESDFKAPIAENVPVLDMDALQQLEQERPYVADSTYRAALYNFLLNIRPRKLSELPDFITPEVLQGISRDLVWSKELTPLHEVLEILMKDTEEFARAYRIWKEDCRATLSSVLRVILSALALRQDGKELLCVGARTGADASAVARKFVESVFDMAMTYASESLETTRSTQVNDLLYRIVSVISDPSSSEWVNAFVRTKNMFAEKAGENYVILAPWMIEQLIPMYLSSPIISLKPGTTIERLEEELSRCFINLHEEELVEVFSELGRFVLEEGKEMHLMIVPCPQGAYMREEVEEKLSRALEKGLHKASGTLLRDAGFFIAIIAGGSERITEELLRSLRGRYGWVGFLADDLKRICIMRIPSERLADFMKSMFVLICEGRRMGYDLEELLGKLRPDQNRRARYFRSILHTWASKQIRDVEGEYNKAVSVKGLKVSELYTDLEKIKGTLRRVHKFAPSTKVISIVFTVLSEEGREVFDDMRILEPGSMVKLLTLPSIYQELRRREQTHINELLGVGRVNRMVELAVADKVKEPLDDAIKYISEERLPFLRDFMEMVRVTLGVDTSQYEEPLEAVYRALALMKLIEIRKGEILDTFIHQAKYLKGLLGRLEELLRDLGRVLEELKNYIPLEVTLARSRPRYITLEEEVEGLRSTLERLVGQAEQLKQSASTGEVLYVISILTLLGLGVERGGPALGELSQNINGWINGVDEIYRPLKDLLNKLRSLGEQLGFLDELRARVHVLEIRIGSGEDLKEAKERISGLCKPVNKAQDDLRELDEVSRKVWKGIEEGVQGSLSDLEKLVRLLGGESSAL